MIDDEQHPRDAIAAYVLGAVTPEEARRVEAHLAECADCRRLERELREVEALLPDLAGEMEPPPRLKARLMATVEAEARGTAGAPAASPGRQPSPDGRARTPLLRLGGPAPTVGAARGAGRARRPRRPFTGAAIALLAAAVLILALVGVGLWAVLGVRQPTPTTVVALAGTAVQPAIRGTLTYYADGNHVDLSVHGLQPLPPGRVYELWLIRGHYQVTNGLGAFRPTPHGTGSLTATSDSVMHYTLACLTVERGPGARRPTLPLVALGNIG